MELINGNYYINKENGFAYVYVGFVHDEYVFKSVLYEDFVGFKDVSKFELAEHFDVLER